MNLFFPLTFIACSHVEELVYRLQALIFLLYHLLIPTAVLYVSELAHDTLIHRQTLIYLKDVTKRFMFH